jgi:hypothetical protein
MNPRRSRTGGEEGNKKTLKQDLFLIRETRAARQRQRAEAQQGGFTCPTKVLPAPGDLKFTLPGLAELFSMDPIRR